MESSQSIKKKHTAQKTKKQTIDFKVLTIGAVIIIGATAPFWHLLPAKGGDKFMGFVSLRGFLYSLGIHLTLLCFSIFVFWLKNFIDPQYKRIIKLINFTSGLFLAISIYFILWVFNTHSDFPNYYYEIAFTIISVLTSYIVYSLNKYIKYIHLEKKYNIRNLLDFIVRVRTDHYKKMVAKAYYAEINNKPMSTNETVEDDANDFEEDLYDTLEKIDNYEALEKANNEPAT